MRVGETPFVTLLHAEARNVLGPRHAVAAVGLALMGVLLAFWLPRFPESVFRFFARVFGLPGWPEIVFANDLTGLFFFLYWVGVFDVLRVYVVPAEERYLDILLSKPLSRRAYLLAKLVPILLTTAGIGAVAAAVNVAGMAAAGLAYEPRAVAGNSAVVVAWAVLLVALVNLLILGTRDSYTALLIAFVPLYVALLPSMVYLYRPDVFADAPALRDVLVFPMNLVWYPEFAARWGWPLAGLMLGLAALLVALAGSRIERRDVA
jgi:hypothetical protein